jgi:predicted dehydrogenase
VALGIAIAGLGPRGRQWVREVRAHPDSELAACADPDPAALRRAGVELGVPSERSFRGLEDALDAVPCDAVIVATPSDLHVEPCELVISRGLGVLVEKPFTQRLREAVRLVELAEQNGTPIVVAQNYRYLRSHRAARRLVDEGALGEVGMAVCQYYNVPRNLFAHARMPHSALWGMAVHHLDAIAHVLDRQITGVMSHSFTTPWGDLPDGASMHALVQLEDGVHAVYSATYESSGHEFFEGGQEYYQRLMGERATLHILHRWLILCERGRRPRVVRRGPRHRTEDAILLDQLRRAMVDGQEPESSGRDNLRTMAVVEACVRSAGEGRWIDPRELLAGTAPSRADRGRSVRESDRRGT